MAKLVSKTYGDALFEVAAESGRVDDFLAEVKAVKAAVDENPELFKLMGHPKIVKEEKVKVIEDIFAEKVTGELVGLLRCRRSRPWPTGRRPAPCTGSFRCVPLRRK